MNCILEQFLSLYLFLEVCIFLHFEYLSAIYTLKEKHFLVYRLRNKKNVIILACYLAANKADVHQNSDSIDLITIMKLGILFWQSSEVRQKAI